MTLEDLVADLELCRGWKQAGGRQDTVFHWYKDINGKPFILRIGGSSEDRGYQCAAPLVSEMMEWHRKQMGKRSHPVYLDEVILDWWDGEVKSLPDALMETLIWCEENKK